MIENLDKSSNFNDRDTDGQSEGVGNFVFVEDFDEVYESIFDFVEQGIMVFTSDLKLVFENITRLFLTDKNSKISQLIKCNPSKWMTFQEIFQQDRNE